jgi:hypothetical protein
MQFSSAPCFGFAFSKVRYLTTLSLSRINNALYGINNVETAPLKKKNLVVSFKGLGAKMN